MLALLGRPSAAFAADAPLIEADDLLAVLETGGAQALRVTTTEVGTPGAPEAAATSGGIRPLAERITELEHAAIREALRHTGGNRTAVARLLGISRASLYDRLQAMGELSEKNANV